MICFKSIPVHQINLNDKQMKKKSISLSLSISLFELFKDGCTFRLCVLCGNIDRAFSCFPRRSGKQNLSLISCVADEVRVFSS